VSSTTFDETALNFLDSLNTTTFKITPLAMVDLTLIRYLGNTGKPMIMSICMDSEDEIDETVTSACE
jgi:N-acetylneuraminate synthase